jgi:RimJ/RimL family protein N-acetyltransferase
MMGINRSPRVIKLVATHPRYRADIQRHASDLRVSATCNIPHPYPQDGATKWMEQTLKSTSEKKNAVFMVLSEDAFCGVMSLNAIDWEKGSAELDYWIAGDYQGRGIGTEAARQAVEHAREEFNLKVLFSACFVMNPASARVLEKNGFREVARILNDGIFGRKFLGQEIRRFRKDLAPGGESIPDRFGPRYLGGSGNGG